MATLNSLAGPKGPLVQISVRLPTGKQPERMFYADQECKRWIFEDVPKLVTGVLNAPLTPREQAYDMLGRWIGGKELRYDRALKDLTPRDAEVWEHKTADLRVFGWMHKPRIFIAVFGGYADDYKGPTRKKSYEDAVRRVENYRTALNLDEPKFVTGTYDDLVRV